MLILIWKVVNGTYFQHVQTKHALWKLLASKDNKNKLLSLIDKINRYWKKHTLFHILAFIDERNGYLQLTDEEYTRAKAKGPTSMCVSYLSMVSQKWKF